MATTAVEKTNKSAIQEMIEKNEIKISQLLPDHVNVSRFVKSALLAVSRNKDLANCTPQSVFTSILNAAELGLDFTPAKGHAYLIPYKESATFMPGYRGMIDLARRSGVVARIGSDIVHKNDVFKLTKGLHPDLIHEIAVDGDAGEMIGAYAVAWFKDGETQYEYMTKKQIDDIRKRAKTDYVWKSDYEEMARKTAVRRLFKYLPCSPDVEKAIEYDNEATGVKTVETDSTTNRTSALADLVSDMGEDAEYTDIPDVPVAEQPKPLAKAEFLKAITDKNTSVFQWDENLLLGIAAHILNKTIVADLEKLTVKELTTVWDTLSDDDKASAAATNYDISVNGERFI